MIKFVLTYQSNPDASMDDFMNYYPQHQAVEDEFIANGKVLGIGPFTNPTEGAMAIFVDRASAEEFAKRDPFLQNGLFSKVLIREWQDDLPQK